MENRSHKILIFLVYFLLVFLLLGSAAFILYQRISKLSETTFQIKEITEKVRKTALRENRFDSEGFNQEIKEIFFEYGQFLNTLTIYDGSGNIVNRFRLAPNNPGLDPNPDWKTEKAMAYNNWWFTMREENLDSVSWPGFSVQALFRILPDEAIVEVLKIDTLVIVALFLISVIILLILPRREREQSIWAVESNLHSEDAFLPIIEEENWEHDSGKEFTIDENVEPSDLSIEGSDPEHRLDRHYSGMDGFEPNTVPEEEGQTRSEPLSESSFDLSTEDSLEGDYDLSNLAVPETAEAGTEEAEEKELSEVPGEGKEEKFEEVPDGESEPLHFLEPEDSLLEELFAWEEQEKSGEEENPAPAREDNRENIEPEAEGAVQRPSLKEEIVIDQSSSVLPWLEDYLSYPENPDFMLALIQLPSHLQEQCIRELEGVEYFPYKDILAVVLADGDIALSTQKLQEIARRLPQEELRIGATGVSPGRFSIGAETALLEAEYALANSTPDMNMTIFDVANHPETQY